MGRFFVVEPGTTDCPIGTGISSQDECQWAYDSLGHNFQFPAKRSMVTGSWEDRPTQCSIHYQGSFVSSNSDQSPHFNSNSAAGTPRARSGEFVPICRAR